MFYLIQIYLLFFFLTACNFLGFMQKSWLKCSFAQMMRSLKDRRCSHSLHSNSQWDWRLSKPNDRTKVWWGTSDEPITAFL